MKSIDQKALFKARPPRKRNKSKFNPDREFCESAVEDYLENGGTIKKVVLDHDTEVLVNDFEGFGSHDIEKYVKHIPESIQNVSDYHID